jgi:cytochrome b6-f complex iron-sulfur subunit
MSEEKNKAQNQPDDPSRRKFFVRMGVGSIAVAALGTGVFGYQYMSPNVLFEPPLIVNAGKPEEYEVNSVTFDPKNSIYIVRDPGGFYSVSAVCTHLGCVTAWKPELDMIACPCHGSKFRKDGTKIEGPAPKPLPWLRMWVSDEGNLMVDRGTTVQAKQFVRV